MVRDGRMPLAEANVLARQVRATGSGSVTHRAPEQPDYWATHPLAAQARARCGHPGRRRYGRAACGPCFEAVIRDDEGLRLLTSPTPRRDPTA